MAGLLTWNYALAAYNGRRVEFIDAADSSDLQILVRLAQTVVQAFLSANQLNTPC